MAGIKCPNCGIGEVVMKEYLRYSTTVQGMPIIVDKATIGICDKCGEEIVEAKEIERWIEELNRKLKEEGKMVSGEEIRNMRKEHDLGVLDFAFMLGVTRQTVYAWENSSSKGMQFGPAAILLKILEEELKGSIKGVFNLLLKAAKQRGQNIKVKRKKDIIAKVGQGKLGEEEKTCDYKTRHIPNGAPRFITPRFIKIVA